MHRLIERLANGGPLTSRDIPDTSVVPWPGYYALPILHGDRLVGKVDAVADRTASILRVNAIHRDAAFTPGITAGVRAELADLAAWLRLAAVELPK